MMICTLKKIEPDQLFLYSEANWPLAVNTNVIPFGGIKNSFVRPELPSLMLNFTPNKHFDYQHGYDIFEDGIKVFNVLCGTRRLI